jgi:hypothetical protein
MSITKLQTVFNTKSEIVKCLVEEWGEKETSFYNTATNKQREKFWTYNRCLKHLHDLRENYVRTSYGRSRKGFEIE